jgi:REase_AHJR-like
MTVNIQVTEKSLETKVAEKYRIQGFEVIVDPSKSVIPFDLGNYLPDIIAKKTSKEGYIIEVKKSISQMPIDRYREIAEIVAQHHGWRFLLITGEDIFSADTKDDDKLLNWEQMLVRQARSQIFLVDGEVEAAFFYSWGVLEAAMRQAAKNAAIPIENLPASSLINHLYSQGELSIEQFDQARTIQEVHDRLGHGYQTPNLMEQTKQLQKLVNELIAMWKICMEE